MTAFAYNAGILHADEVSLAYLASEVGTPFYVYSASAMRAQLTALQSAFADLSPLIAYAMKANANQAVLKLLGQHGAGMDVVSGGELRRALKAGIDPKKIVFSGVGKTADEMRQGLTANIHCFNVESEPELDRLNTIAKSMDKLAPVSVRINPNVDAKTHAKISTGKSENKFGLPFEHAQDIYAKIAAASNLQAIGVDMHIGSQLIDLEPFDNAFALLAELTRKLIAAGHDIKHVDIGGGLGIAYENNDAAPDLDTYAKIVHRHIAPLNLDLIIEPGRWLVGNAGVLVTKVEYVKTGTTHKFVIVDAAMNDLLRPALYEAYHDILPVAEPAPGVPLSKVDIVGPVCESGDYFARNRELPPVAENDLVAIMGAGAYGAVMASTYNTRPLIAEVLVEGNRYHLIRPRQNVDNLIGLDKIPDWL